jgi:hypothetical protein
MTTQAPRPGEIWIATTGQNIGLIVEILGISKARETIDDIAADNRFNATGWKHQSPLYSHIYFYRSGSGLIHGAGVAPCDFVVFAPSRWDERVWFTTLDEFLDIFKKPERGQSYP